MKARDASASKNWSKKREKMGQKNITCEGGRQALTGRAQAEEQAGQLQHLNQFNRNFIRTS